MNGDNYEDKRLQSLNSNQSSTFGAELSDDGSDVVVKTSFTMAEGLITKKPTKILGGGSLSNITGVNGTAQRLAELQNLNTGNGNSAGVGADCTVESPCSFNMKGKLIDALDCPAGCYANKLNLVVEVGKFWKLF